MGELITRQQVTPFGATEIAQTWRWRDRMNGWHYPRDMRTGHLFNTLRMIWNNTVPEEMRVGAVKLYTFGEVYTKPYLKTAIALIGRELLRRTDLTPQQKQELNEMASWFAQWSEVDQQFLKEVRYLK